MSRNKQEVRSREGTNRSYRVIYAKEERGSEEERASSDFICVEKSHGQERIASGVEAKE